MIFMGELLVSGRVPKKMEENKKNTSPGDSNRDLFIPKRWVGHVCSHLKGSRELTIPKRSRKRRIARLMIFQVMGWKRLMFSMVFFQLVIFFRGRDQTNVPFNS